MAYEGDLAVECPSHAHDFSNTWVIVVSGAAINPCGHMILNVGGIGGTYVHVAGVRGFPRFMSEMGYRRYLTENGKKELRRARVPISKPDAAMVKLEWLLSQKWTWGVLPHNCAAFVEDVVRAGGSNAGLYLNCPTIETFD